MKQRYCPELTTTAGGYKNDLPISEQWELERALERRTSPTLSTRTSSRPSTTSCEKLFAVSPITAQAVHATGGACMAVTIKGQRSFCVTT